MLMQNLGGQTKRIMVFSELAYCDWFIALFVPVVIGRSSCFGFGFSTVI